MHQDRRVIVFDLDDTLAPSKSAIDPTMAELLGRLLSEVRVCIISGGRFEQFENQVLSRLVLDADQLSDLHLMPTCGTRYYRYERGGWEMVYAEDLTPSQKDQITSVLSDGAHELGLWEPDTWGDRIEDRGSQVTFSALGQSAPVDAKSAWDPAGTKKKALRDYAAPRLPGLEVRSGGSTSIDVTRLGIDKAHGIRKLMEQLDIGLNDMLFIGDRLDEGGNDYPVKQLGVRCVPVAAWQETEKHIARLITWLPENPGEDFKALFPQG